MREELAASECKFYRQWIFLQNFAEIMIYNKIWKSTTQHSTLLRSFCNA